jgi:hypothetical protein
MIQRIVTSIWGSLSRKQIRRDIRREAVSDRFSRSESAGNVPPAAKSLVLIRITRMPPEVSKWGYSGALTEPRASTSNRFSSEESSLNALGRISCRSAIMSFTKGGKPEQPAGEKTGRAFAKASVGHPLLVRATRSTPPVSHAAVVDMDEAARPVLIKPHPTLVGQGRQAAQVFVRNAVHVDVDGVEIAGRVPQML